MPLQGLLQEGQRRRFVALLRDITLQHFALVIDRAPKVMGLAVDLHEDFIDIPAALGEAHHSAYALPFDVLCEHRTKPIPPQPHGFMANVDPALEEQVLDVSKAKRIPDIQHHRHADHFWR